MIWGSAATGTAYGGWVSSVRMATHRPCDHDRSGFLPAERGQVGFEFQGRPVLAEDIVAETAHDHGAQDLQRRNGDDVAYETGE
jgi:hypothetical protein